jgi:soluble lytic murein transglycosylase-like protein
MRNRFTQNVGLAAAGVIFAAAAVCAQMNVQLGTPVTKQPNSIVAVHQDGKTIWMNADETTTLPGKLSNVSQPKAVKYIYWSNAEHRWKAVPTPTHKQLVAARSAADDVTKFVANTPGAELPVAKPTPESGYVAQDRPAERPVAEKPVPPAVERAAQAIDPEYRAQQKAKSGTANAEVPLSMPERVESAIQKAAERHGVDANLVRAIIQVESANNPYAISRKGAIGLMQLMPKTAHELNVVNPFDPAQNIDAGVKHFKGLLDANNGNVPLSLAAYNAGQGAVDRNGGIPPYSETRNYVKKITQIYGTTMAVTAAQPTGISNIKVSRDTNGHLVFTNQ